MHTLILSLVFAVLVCACSSSVVQPTPPTILQPLTCDDSLWAPTYSLNRLFVLAACKVAAGIVRFVELEYDGDASMHIQVYPEYTDLLGPGNIFLDNGPNKPLCTMKDPATGKDIVTGCLMVEVPCQKEVDVKNQPDAKGVCDGYTGPKFVLPVEGQCIEAAAHWVEDGRHYRWRELHGAIYRIVACRAQ